jgi:hypothetical protein
MVERFANVVLRRDDEGDTVSDSECGSSRYQALCNDDEEWKHPL